MNSYKGSRVQGGLKGHLVSLLIYYLQGLRLSDKQRVSAWEIVEGGRSPAPLSWAWFGGTKIDRKPLTYEHTHK